MRPLVADIDLDADDEEVRAESESSEPSVPVVRAAGVRGDEVQPREHRREPRDEAGEVDGDREFAVRDGEQERLGARPRGAGEEDPDQPVPGVVVGHAPGAIESGETSERRQSERHLIDRCTDSKLHSKVST